LDLKAEEDKDLPEKPALYHRRTGLEEESNVDGHEWREKEFWSEWEVMGSVVSEEEFVRNRERVGRKERRERLRERGGGKEMTMGTRMGTRSEEYAFESNGDEDEAEEMMLEREENENTGGMNNRHVENEELGDTTKHSSYAVYNSDN
jgi:hypothetical protein